MDPSAILHIDLAAIAENWRLLAARAAPGAVAGVVKANAYGLGADRVAPALQAAGCRHFFVAHLAEGVALRAALGPGLREHPEPHLQRRHAEDEHQPRHAEQDE